MTNESWATVLIGIVGTVGTVAAGIIGYQSGAKAVEKDYVQIAISTLDKKDSSPELRTWSVDVLNKLSPVPFGKKLEKQLTQSGFNASSLYVMKVNLDPELRKRCPDILARTWAKKEVIAGRDEVIDLMEQYDYCRIRLDSVLELIDQLNELADKTNREQGLTDPPRAAASDKSKVPSR